MYHIKQIPEDFIVKEIMDLKLEPGRYSYYLLKKKNYNTIDAIRVIAKNFRINRKFINFAGTKDRNAITEQYISISRGPKKDLHLKDIDVKFLGTGCERLNLGTREGNEFTIVIRNIKTKPKPIKEILNLFDAQRFGSKQNNHIIGKAIVKKEFAEAVKLIDDEQLSEHLNKHPNDYIGALKKLPKQILRLYVHAYQSYLWNQMAKDSIEHSIPLIGFETTEDVEILQNEGISKIDFLIRQIPEISSEGAYRNRTTKVNNLKVSELEPDELNSGMNKVTVSFSLQKGSYATQVIKQMATDL